MVHEIDQNGIKTPPIPDIPYSGPVYYVATLTLSRPTEHPHIRVDAAITTAVKVSGYSAEGEREQAARAAAEQTFRHELGLGQLMNGGSYTIMVTLA